MRWITDYSRPDLGHRKIGQSLGDLIRLEDRVVLSLQTHVAYYHGVPHQEDLSSSVWYKLVEAHGQAPVCRNTKLIFTTAPGNSAVFVLGPNIEDVCTCVSAMVDQTNAFFPSSVPRPDCCDISST